MQRARCCAANAYDVTSAIQAIFGRSRRAHISRQPTDVCHGVRSRDCNTQRSFGAAARDARQKELDTSVGEPTTKDDRRAQKLAFYEELMIGDSGYEGDPAFTKATQNRGKPPDGRLLEQSSTATQPWRDHMAAMSQYIRNRREKQFEDTSEALENPDFVKFLDYDGLVITPAERNVSPPTPIPWAQSYSTRQKPYKAAQILDFEIAAFWKYMTPTEKEKRVRHRVKKLIWPILRPKYESGNLAVYSYGSAVTGLEMPYSDIDIAIRDPNDSRNTMESEMKYLLSALLKDSEFMCVVYRGPPHAIITAQHRDTGIEVQVVAHSVPGYQDMVVLKLLKLYPHLHELYAVVRTAFGIRGLVDPYVGGISAYGTFMMIAASLTRRGTPSDVHKSPSAQLLHFLNFWANFDTVKYGMTISKNFIAKPFLKLPPLISDAASKTQNANFTAALRTGRKRRAGQYRMGLTNPRQPYLLCFQDPSNRYNDLGKNCHAIKHIQATVKAMHQDLVASMAKYDEGIRRRNASKDEQSLLLPLVGRSHEMYAERRERMVTRPRNLKNDEADATTAPAATTTPAATTAPAAPQRQRQSKSKSKSKKSWHMTKTFKFSSRPRDKVE